MTSFTLDRRSVLKQCSKTVSLPQGRDSLFTFMRFDSPAPRRMAEIIIPFRFDWNFVKFNVFLQFLSSIGSESAEKKYFWPSKGNVEYQIVDDAHLDPETSSG